MTPVVLYWLLSGVMKHVGKALREHTLRSKHKIHAIGVVSWGIVVGNSELQEREKKQHAVSLYFILNRRIHHDLKQTNIHLH